MRCKECREKIPDNVKYCPECGALVNDIKYPINNNSSYNIHTSAVQPSAHTPQPSAQSYKTKQQKESPDIKKASKIASAVIFAIIFIFTALSSIIEEFSGNSNFEINEEIDVSVTAEDTAYSYVYHLLTSVSETDYDTFNYYTTIDWSVLCADIEKNYDNGYTIAQNAYCNFLLDNSMIEIIPDDYSYFDVCTQSVTTYDYSEIYTYIGIFEDLIRPFSLSAAHYIPYSDIRDIVCVEFYIDFYDENDEIISSELVEVTVIRKSDEFYSDSFYDVIYDNFFMEEFIKSLYPEEIMTIQAEYFTDI